MDDTHFDLLDFPPETERPLTIETMEPPPPGKLSVIEARTGSERRIVHEWAEWFKISSAPLTTSAFASNCIRWCKGCLRFIYSENVSNKHVDEYGCGLYKCKLCGDLWDLDEAIKGWKTCPNAVAVGHSLPKFSKKASRRKRLQKVHGPLPSFSKILSNLSRLNDRRVVLMDPSSIF